MVLTLVEMQEVGTTVGLLL